VISKATAKFWKCYRTLPIDVRRQAKDAYALFQNDSWYPSLRFKRVHSNLPVYSVRVTKDYRAVGILKEERVVWFWIGSHSEYDKLLKQLKST